MSMTTTTANPNVKITDPTLLYFQQEDEKIFQSLQGSVEENFPKWEEKYREVQQFKVDVNNLGSDLQHMRIVVPASAELQEKRGQFVTKYWEFIGVCEKMNLFAHRIQKTMVQLTPTSRSYSMVQTLEKEQPEFMSQVKTYEVVCHRYVEQLTASFSKVESLQKTMVTFLRTETAQSMQRFCQIVDNAGKPISTLQWAANKLTSPVVPLPVIKKTEGSDLEKKEEMPQASLQLEEQQLEVQKDEGKDEQEKTMTSPNSTQLSSVQSTEIKEDSHDLNKATLGTQTSTLNPPIKQVIQSTTPVQATKEKPKELPTPKSKKKDQVQTTENN